VIYEIIIFLCHSTVDIILDIFILLANSPDWFNHESLSSQSSHGKLEHAFQLAYDRLSIDKLLDWQGPSTIFYSLLRIIFAPYR